MEGGWRCWAGPSQIQPTFPFQMLLCFLRSWILLPPATAALPRAQRHPDPPVCRASSSRVPRSHGNSPGGESLVEGVPRGKASAGVSEGWGVPGEKCPASETRLQRGPPWNLCQFRLGPAGNPAAGRTPPHRGEPPCTWHTVRVWGPFVRCPPPPGSL